MNLWQNYVLPASLSEALQALKSAPGPVFPIAGGTDLLLDLKQGRHFPAHTLVDLTSVTELTVLETRGDQLHIGAAVPLSRIVRHPMVIGHARALVEACDLVGGPQVRNVATLGGNVAHALPAADGTIALLALDAQVEIAGLGGVRRMALSELFAGPGKSTIRQGEELIVDFQIPLKNTNQASCFKRIMRPQGVALPIINVAIWLELEADTIAEVRIAVGPGGPTPWRARDAEGVLIGKPMSADTAAAALQALLGEARFRSSARRASSEYRRHLVESLFSDTLTVAWQRALQEDDRHA